jgi:protein SCO1/2
MMNRIAAHWGVAGLLTLGPADMRTFAAERCRIGYTARSDASNSATSLPNVVLWTHEGKRVRFYDDVVKGKVVLINFMFTSCRNQCPRTTANLVKVAQGLGERLGRDVVMISITIDPETDTPKVLKTYSQRYGTKPGWYFLTGPQKDIDLVRQRLGASDSIVDKTSHAGMLIYGNDATDQWAAAPALANPRTITLSIMRLVGRKQVT